MVADNPNWPPPKNPPKVVNLPPGHAWESLAAEEDGDSGTGIGVLILGVFVVWLWGAICGWLLTWLFLKS